MVIKDQSSSPISVDSRLRGIYHSQELIKEANCGIRDLNVTKIEYIGISIVLFFCKNRSQKNHDSVKGQNVSLPFF